MVSQSIYIRKYQLLKLGTDSAYTIPTGYYRFVGRWQSLAAVTRCNQRPGTLP